MLAAGAILGVSEAREALAVVSSSGLKHRLASYYVYISVSFSVSQGRTFTAIDGDLIGAAHAELAVASAEIIKLIPILTERSEPIVFVSMSPYSKLVSNITGTVKLLDAESCSMRSSIC